jgi:hypothetical protein
MMNWKGFGRKQSWPNFKAALLDGQGKNTKVLSQPVSGPNVEPQTFHIAYEVDKLTI